VTLKQVLAQARQIFTTNRVEDASLEGEILLRHTLKMNRAGLYSELDRELGDDRKDVFWNLVQRRINGEPTAYITGHREFYGLEFYIDHRVLIPRPETELLVEKALEMARTRTMVAVADIGTGCGAIAISLARHLPRLKIYASDVSADALEVAHINCQKHGVVENVQLRHGDMLEPLPEPIDLIVANLPYVTGEEISRSLLADFEPLIALDGGADGLDKIKRLLEQATDKLSHDGCILLELGLGQSQPVVNLIHRHFPSASVEVIPDLQGIERVVSLCLTPN
jgi:release factor glutamine methyltransferase